MTASLWRHSDFMKLWVGQTISRLGSVVTRTAMPLVALLVLGAGPFELAIVVISQSLGVLLVGLFAGAWVDRLRRKPLLIAADAIRAFLLLSIPAAYLAGVLRLEQIYVVVFFEACFDSLFNAAYPAYVPSLIGVDRVVEGNSKLAASTSLAEIGGPGPRRRPRAGHRRALRDLRRRDLLPRLGGFTRPDPPSRTSAAATHGQPHPSASRSPKR